MCIERTSPEVERAAQHVEGAADGHAAAGLAVAQEAARDADGEGLAWTRAWVGVGWVGGTKREREIEREGGGRDIHIHIHTISTGSRQAGGKADRQTGALTHWGPPPPRSGAAGALPWPARRGSVRPVGCF